MNMVQKGLPVSRGIAVGHAFCYVPVTTEECIDRIKKEGLTEGRKPEEVVHQAVETAKAELARLTERIAAKSPDQAKILGAHVEILEDETMEEDLLMTMEDGETPEDALMAVFGSYIKLFAKSKEQRIRERVPDLTDVRNRLLRIMAELPERNLSDLPEPCVVFASDLLPADTAGIDRENVLGIVTENGGETSHTSIIARSYGIPCIVGTGSLLPEVRDGMTVAVDAVEGKVILEPTPEEEETYRRRMKHLASEKAETEKYRKKACFLTDGTHVEICANLAKISKEELAVEEYTDGVGLLRSEFLYMGRETLPTEEEQTEAYARVLRAFKGKPVVLRTLDIGGDKEAACLDLPKEQNPFLGVRALRLCFAQPELFRTQLRAALRASTAGNLWIMFPMVASVDDFKKAKGFLLEEKEKLLKEGVPVADTIKVGAMIEIPAIAIAADSLARVADFASIGSNDLTQYLTAVDRTLPSVASYCQKYHPAVWRTISIAAEAFVRAGKPISVCGELGGDPLAAPALIGSGIRKLSMSGGVTAQVKRALMAHSLEDCRKLCRSVCLAQDAAEAEAALKAF